MIEAIPPDGPGPIFVYHNYEALRLRDLADRHPQYGAQVAQCLLRLVDLLPIVKANYYHPAMRGSFSIKAVLPTIAPDLDYDNLKDIADGTAAQVAYLYAALDSQTTPERRAELRDRLLIYCKHDTWAMARVAHFLQRRGPPTPPIAVP
jgi:predicted RecB family nuclease